MLFVVLILMTFPGRLHVVQPLALLTLTLSPQAVAPEQAGTSEKDARTPAQRKINSQLLYEIYRRRGQAELKGVPPGPTGVDIDAADRALVDIRAPVTPVIEKKLRILKSVVVSTDPSLQSIIARVPVLSLEALAEEPAVRAIEPAAEAITNR